MSKLVTSGASTPFWASMLGALLMAHRALASGRR